MTEPPRLTQESRDDLELALLRAGSDVSASPELREKTLATLGLGGAAAAGAAVGAGAFASGSAKGAGGVLSLLSLKVSALAVGVALAVGGPVYLLTGEAPAPVLRLAKPARPLDQLASRLPDPDRREPRPQATGAPTAAAPPSPSPKSAPAEALRAELAQLDAARARLGSNRPEEALRLLDAYARSKPNGRLRLEAEVLRIDALAKSGRTDQAKARARAFLARHPSSVMAARVRRIAGD